MGHYPHPTLLCPLLRTSQSWAAVTGLAASASCSSESLEQKASRHSHTAHFGVYMSTFTEGKATKVIGYLVLSEIGRSSLMTLSAFYHNAVVVVLLVEHKSLPLILSHQ